MSRIGVNKVVIGLGSNSPDRHVRMRRGVEWLSSVLSDIKVSDIYSTPAINGTSPDYLNAVAAGDTTIELDQLNQMLKQYEVSEGRTKESKQTGVVPIDLDIVIFNGEILRAKDFGYDFFQRGYRQISE